MFHSSHWKRFFCRSISSFCTEVNKKPITYGNSSMPDKLYKTLELEMKSAEPAVLRSYESFIRQAAKFLKIEIGSAWTQKPLKQRWTLLRSVHVHRKHLVQYEVRTHFRWIQLHRMTGSTADTFLEYVQRMLPEGVGLKVTRITVEPLPSHINKEAVTDLLSCSGVDHVENKSESEPLKVKKEEQNNIAKES